MAATAEARPLWLQEEVDLGAERRARRRSRARRLGTGALGLLGVVVLWQLAAMVLDDAVILPSATRTAHAFVHYLGTPYPSHSLPLWRDLLVSLRRILVGFAGGVAAGVAIGAAMSASRPLRHLIDPVIETTRPLPPLAFIPLFIVWFGIGELPKEVLIGFGVLPVMVIATLAALDDVPDDLRFAARTLGASPAYTLLHVQIRAALPGIVTGMRIALGGAWTSIVAAEMLAATSGIGFVIGQAGNYLDTALVFACIILIGATELILDAGLRLAARRIDPTLS
jgi:NitT/TauT family transport system permease protein/taurine transport system permease protein